MPKPTDKQRISNEHVRMVGDLMEYYRESLKLIPPSEKPADLKAVIEAGVKIMTFLRQTMPTKDDQAEGSLKRGRPRKADRESVHDLTAAFKALDALKVQEESIVEGEPKHE